jgi:hypothetical protein
MWVRVKDIEQGLHPSEAIVMIETVQGQEEVVVDRRVIQHNSIEVGQPVAVSPDDKYYLVELPAETSRGAWRVWVAKTLVAQRIPEPAE